MSKKLLPFLSLIFIGVMSTSCEKNELEEVVAASAVKVEKASSANVLVEETFESGSGLDNFHSDDFGASHSFTLVSNPVMAGSKAARFELRDTDPMVSSGTRAEVTVIKDESSAMEKEMWYSFGVFFPSVGYEADLEKEIISQWHQSGGASPPISLIIRNDKINIEVRNQIDVKNYFELGSITKDKWTQYTFHIIHSKGTDGIVEIWQNSTKIFTFKGANLYQVGDDLPKWKMGMYKWKWNGTETTNTKKRVLYFDNVRAGNSKTNFAEMTAGGSSATATTPIATTPTETNPTVPVVTEPTAPTAPVIGTGFTFVNANTEQDIKALTNGSTLSLSQIGTEKVNIRFNSAAIPAGGSVKFELSGAKTHTYADNAAPYALFGDNGKGDYYHSGGTMLAGQYTLKATPYSGQKGTGTAGTPVSVTFTITTSTIATTPTEPTATTPTETNPTVPVVTAPTAPTAPVTAAGFIFVNANTEQDIKAVTNGATLSLSQIGTEKVNIRFNSAAIPAGGSVKFELSGAKTHTYADNAAPYAMYGDNGKGDFYYGGSTMVAGQYTLKATPYSGQKGTGTAGTPVSVTFTIVK